MPEGEYIPEEAREGSLKERLLKFLFKYPPEVDPEGDFRKYNIENTASKIADATTESEFENAIKDSVAAINRLDLPETNEVGDGEQIPKNYVLPKEYFYSVLDDFIKVRRVILYLQLGRCGDPVVMNFLREHVENAQWRSDFYGDDIASPGNQKALEFHDEHGTADILQEGIDEDRRWATEGADLLRECEDFYTRN